MLDKMFDFPVELGFALRKKRFLRFEAAGGEDLRSFERKVETARYAGVEKRDGVRCVEVAVAVLGRDERLKEPFTGLVADDVGSDAEHFGQTRNGEHVEKRRIETGEGSAERRDSHGTTGSARRGGRRGSAQDWREKRNVFADRSREVRSCALSFRTANTTNPSAIRPDARV